MTEQRKGFSSGTFGYLDARSGARGAHHCSSAVPPVESGRLGPFVHSSRGIHAPRHNKGLSCGVQILSLGPSIGQAAWPKIGRPGVHADP